MKTQKLSPTKHNLADQAGRLFQRVGLPRSMGQIYGLLYMSMEPMSLTDIGHALGISKACVSTGTRQLAGMGVIKQVWVPGERREFYESVGDISEILRSVYQKFFRPRVGATGRSLSAILQEIDKDRISGRVSEEEAKFSRTRMESLVRLQQKIEKLAPMAEALLFEESHN